MKVFFLVLVLSFCQLHAQEKYTVMSSFSLEDKKKTINFDKQNVLSDDDFLLVHNEINIYILDFKTGEKIGKLPFFILDYCVYIESDNKGNAMITYTTALESLVGENYNVPQSQYHELIYKNGVYNEI